MSRKVSSALLLSVLIGLGSVAAARAATLPFMINLPCGAGTGLVGTYWISLPNASPIKTAEELCALIPNAVSVAQRLPLEFGNSSSPLPGEWTYDCAMATCTPSANTFPPHEQTCPTTTCFCVNPGDGFQVKVSAMSSFQVDGCESQAPLVLPFGSIGYLVSVPFQTNLVTYNDLALAAGLPSTGLASERGTVTGLDGCTGIFTSRTAGTTQAMTTSLVPGLAYRLNWPSSMPGPHSFPNPTTSISTCDSKPPLCDSTISGTGASAIVNGTATDNSLPGDAGIVSVALDPASMDVVCLECPQSYAAMPAPTVAFSLRLAPGATGGRGSVIVTDKMMNTCRVAADFTSMAAGPVVNRPLFVNRKQGVKLTATAAGASMAGTAVVSSRLPNAADASCLPPCFEFDPKGLVLTVDSPISGPASIIYDIDTPDDFNLRVLQHHPSNPTDPCPWRDVTTSLQFPPFDPRLGGGASFSRVQFVAARIIPGCSTAIAVDQDGDGYFFGGGTPAATADCNDVNPNIHPGAPEVCNLLDDNCNGPIDDATPPCDHDGDGLLDPFDNCGTTFNPDQSDFDQDGQGDLCDLDDGLILVTIPDNALVGWQPETGFFPFNEYRGDLGFLRQTGVYTQDPAAVPLAIRNCGLTSRTVPDGPNPPLGEAVFYLVTGIVGGAESGLGTDSGGMPRPNTHPCP